MVIDTSALIAVLLDEPEAERIVRAMSADATLLVSAFTVLEACTVLETRKGDVGAMSLDLFLQRGRIQQVPFSQRHGDAARAAWRKYGKGRHAAGLNLGDCVAYALARASDEPLLFKGKDFEKTDVVAVEY